MVELTIRIIMAVLSTAMLWLHSAWIRNQWGKSSRWINLGRIGLSGVLLYSACGQIKALVARVPVDAVTFIGLVALTLGFVGFLMEFMRVRVFPRQEE